MKYEPNPDSTRKASQAFPMKQKQSQQIKQDFKQDRREAMCGSATEYIREN